ncbi:alpha-glucosidase [Vagococcus sp.]|uniref:alpha-glucosidase n=1 Tax=Vagococcus sp. TaxID=1933889 RepID=UPI003F98DB27
MKKWWKESVFYQIYPKSFKDSNQDGVGDLRGIISKLDYLEDLGIDVIWISPFFESPMVDNGYDISNYYKVDPIFGNNADLEELIAEAKKRKIKLIFDLVVNHCSDQHEWFQKAITDPNSEERDYFVIKKKEEITNWRAIFGGNSWTPLPGSEEDYYFHVFAKEQPDLNWENPKLRKKIYEMINYWLDKGVAGFRVDAISYLKKNQEFPNFEPDGLDGLAHVDKGSINQPGINAFLSELRKETFDKYDCVTVGEAFGVPFEDLGIYVGDQGCFSMIFEFSYDHPSVPKGGDWHEYQAWTVDEWKQQIFEAQAQIAKIGWSPSHIENHDSPRALNKFIEKVDQGYGSATMLATLYFYLRSSPFIYQGQEIGMTNVDYESIDVFDDLSTHDHFQRALAYGHEEAKAFELISPRSRDNARSPMQWNNEQYAGFSTVEPWLPVKKDYPEINVAKELKTENSILNFYKKMIRLRKETMYQETLVYGEFKPLFETISNLVAYERVTDNQKIWVLNNFQNVPLEVELTKNYEVLLSNFEVFETQGLFKLQPYQSLVLKINDK